MNVLTSDSLAALQARLGVEFDDPELLMRSLAHRSWCAENGDVSSNERLEFLGDSVLGLVVTRFVFENFPELPEGQLSEVRAGVVNARTLADVAGELCLGEFLLLGKGELAAGGSTKPSILSDAMEAVIAVVYLDQGWSVAQQFVLRLLEPRIREAAVGPGGRDFKTRLQELTAHLSLGRPRYAVEDDGPDHAKRFYASVFVGGIDYGRGEGRSKKEAEQGAALQAWLQLQGDSFQDATDRRVRDGAGHQHTDRVDAHRVSLATDLGVTPEEGPDAGTA